MTSVYQFFSQKNNIIEKTPAFVTQLVNRNILATGSRNVNAIFGILLLYVNKLRYNINLPSCTRKLYREKMIKEVKYLQNYKKLHCASSNFVEQ